MLTIKIVASTVCLVVGIILLWKHLVNKKKQNRTFTFQNTKKISLFLKQNIYLVFALFAFFSGIATLLSLLN